MKLHIAFLAAAITLGLAACNKPAEAPSDSGASTTAPADTTTATEGTEVTPAEGGTTATPDEGSTGDEAPALTASTGVQECDEYIAAVNACIAKNVPADQQEAQIKAFEQTMQAWKGIPDSAMAEACKMARDASKDAYAQIGCEM